MAYHGVLLDLFGTLITFDVARLPTLSVGGRTVHTTLGATAALAQAWVPHVSVEELFQALMTVSEEMARARAYDYVELPSRERFRRALERVACDDAVLVEAAVQLSRAHMQGIADVTAFPPAHRALLDALRPRFRLALVSNFDDTAAAYDILARHGILPYLDTVVVSEAIGLRKPHPALVRAALRSLDLAPEAALFVGDNLVEDGGAARAAGVDLAWIDGAGRGVPDGTPAPRYVVRALPELADVLAETR
jgi:HAD superfamily hydrolase (TIGR01549 family)